ncbi:MAG: hypothetical protein AB8B64_09965 [Granulosicoccus sp.]
MMDNHWLNEAIYNNAVWCHAIAASHGISSKWETSAWVSQHSMPPLYPNIITLRSGKLIDEQISAVRSQLPLGWAIKDSFAELELKDKGFTHAFNAYWYCRTPHQNVIDEYNPVLHIETVKTRLELNAWVIAWGDSKRVFNDSLLENKAVELIYMTRNGKVLAGLATNHSSESVGMSNAFGKPDDVLSCVASVIRKYPDKGIVGYGNEAEIATLSILGFKETGNLRIWLCR